MNNRISVTTLDSYQYFLDSQHGDNPMSEQELYEQLFGGFTPTFAMQAGTAWHEILEYWQDGNPLINQSFTFDLSTLNSDDTLVLGEPYEREQKHVWQGVAGVDLVGKIDVETAFALYDHKLTANFDPERYLKSWQWRAYLTMRQKQKFVYQVFEANISDDGFVSIHDYHALAIHAYDGMEQEVCQIVADLSDLFDKWQKFGVSSD